MAMTFTPRLHSVLGRAATEAKYAGRKAIGVEHVFLAMLDDEDSIPTQVMNRLGLVDQLRSELRSVLASEGYRTPGPPPPSN
jgi:ATP-dependent Clp protease ATP-binding subunit ClpA